MSKWKEVKLENVCEVNPESIDKNYQYELIEYLDISTVGTGTLNNSPTEYYFKDAPSRARRLVKDGDTIISMVRPNLRSLIFIKNPKDNLVVSTGFAVLRSNDKINNKYLYYSTFNPTFTEFLSKNAKGTSYPAVDTNTIERAEIPLPPLETQKKIASILSAYDDLIENNRRRITLLEESARLLYKEWFVKFKFPGHEKVKMKNGIPEGWEKGTISDISKVKNGFAFKSHDWRTEGFPVIKIKNIQENGSVDILNCDFVEETIITNLENFKLIEGDLLIAMTGATVGKVGILPKSNKSCYLNQRVGVFKSIDNINYIPFLKIFFSSETAQTYIQNLAKGAAQPNISAEQIESIPLLLPNSKILRLFLDLIGVNFNQILNLTNQNQKLREARDILLPKLMNGKIEV